MVWRITFMKINYLTLLILCFFLIGCSTPKKFKINKNHIPKKIEVITTGYCKCQKCCGWTRNWKGQPVYAYGKLKGKKKKVGITSLGVKAQKGTIAADLSKFPYNTVIYIPGYGWGKVEDIGSAIKGYHIDLYFDSHQEALNWGKQKKMVHIWEPVK